MTLDAGVAGILGSAVGGVLGLASGAIGARAQRKTVLQQTRQDAYARYLTALDALAEAWLAPAGGEREDALYDAVTTVEIVGGPETEGAAVHLTALLLKARREDLSDDQISEMHQVIANHRRTVVRAMRADLGSGRGYV